MQFVSIELLKGVLSRIFASGALTQHDLQVPNNVGNLNNWLHKNYTICLNKSLLCRRSVCPFLCRDWAATLAQPSNIWFMFCAVREVVYYWVQKCTAAMQCLIIFTDRPDEIQSLNIFADDSSDDVRTAW